MNSQFKEKLPKLSVILASTITGYFLVMGTTNYLSLIFAQFFGKLPNLLIFGDPSQPRWYFTLLITAFAIFTWLGSTKYKGTQTRKWRIYHFYSMFLSILFHYLWLITAPVYNTVAPYITYRVNEIGVRNVWQAVMIGNPQVLVNIILLVPTIVVVIVLLWISGQYSKFSDDIKERFFEFEFINFHLQKFYTLGNKEHWPDVILGPDSKNKELVVQPGRDRTLNNIIIGSIGTGKTAALVLPILNQDLHWMTKFINDYPQIYKRDDYKTEEVQGMYLNGISVIEPSNDLCQKVYQLVKAHGIPEETVFYIDPTNPLTPSINPMQGPVDKVAEAFSMVIEGLAEGGNSNFFFQQSERNHLKHYIYLLKLHEPEKEVTFDMLLQMYDNPQLVRKMHLKLKETIPKNIGDIEDRDERNHWMIVKQIDEWFNTNLLPKKVRAGASEVEEKVTEGEYRGEAAYYDAKAEYVQGLRNILNDIGANKLIRRVLFGKSTFNWDKHLEFGGILLVNTAKGELGSLSNVLGKLILLSLQNAVFRRPPNISTFHHILVDEFPDFVYQPFKEFPAQSRKYKAIVTVVAQTITQLADKYGDNYMHTLLGTLRHKMVYGDIPNFDAELFSKALGEVDKYDESMSEQTISTLEENPSARTGSSFQKKREALLSPSDLIYQKAFQCAVKIVANNEPKKVRQIDANFVPKEEFKMAKVSVKEDSTTIWLEERRKGLLDIPDVIKEPVEELRAELIEEQQTEQVKYFTEKPIIKEEPPLKEEGVENSLRTGVDYDNPIDEYQLVTEEIPEEIPITKNIQGKESASIPIPEHFQANIMNTSVSSIQNYDISNLFGSNKPAVHESQIDEKAESLMETLQKELNSVPAPAPKDEKQTSNLESLYKPF